MPHVPKRDRSWKFSTLVPPGAWLNPAAVCLATVASGLLALPVLSQSPEAVPEVTDTPAPESEASESEATEPDTPEASEPEAIEIEVIPPAEPGTPQQQLQDARQQLLQPGLVEPAEAANSEPPMQLQDQLAPEFDQYRLGPGDTIFVNVLRFPELSFQATLDLEGRILVPLAGAVQLQDLNLTQARDLLQRELNRYVVNPEVDVILTAQRPVQVTVLGEVVRPGLYPLGAPQLAVALATAGGTTKFADLRVVRIRRYLEDGSILEQDVDLYTPLNESFSIPNIRLADGDTVIVPILTTDTVEDYDRQLVAQTTLAQQEIVVRVLNYTTSNLGAIALPNGSSFLDAITQVGINPDQANFSEIALIRFDPLTGRPVIRELNARDAVAGDFSQDPPLEHNDVIVIGRNFIGRLSYVLNTVSQPFRDVLSFLLFFQEVDNVFQDGLFNDGDNNN
jgi:polysaccharide export outer membrane protein